MLLHSGHCLYLYLLSYSCLCLYFYLASQNISVSILVPTLQMENLRFREVKIFAYSYTASEGRAIFKGLSDSNDVL